MEVLLYSRQPLHPTGLYYVILLAGHLSFGILESYHEDVARDRRQHRNRTGARPHLSGKWPHLASAYITGISVGILVRSPAFWPYRALRRSSPSRRSMFCA